jgi:hypothetical protein
MSDEQPEYEVLAELLRSDLYSFVWKAFETLHPGESFIAAKHVEAICWHLQQVAEGRIRRLLITVPPRHLKSICTSVGFAAWMLGRNPALKLLVASYGHDLAAKHARDFRTVVEAPWCKQVFPRLLAHPQRNTESEFMTTARGLHKAVSLGGAVTGHGADILIIDDMLKADDARSETERRHVHDFYEQTLFSRLNDKRNGAIIAIQQRLHEDDLAGYLLAKGNFTHLELKAIAEEDEEHALGERRVYRRRACARWRGSGRSEQSGLSLPGPSRRSCGRSWCSCTSMASARLGQCASIRPTAPTPCRSCRRTRTDWRATSAVSASRPLTPSP